MIQSVLKALDVMDVFSPSEPRLTLAEISSRLDLPKSTVHNLLNTLVSRRFIEKADSDHYALGTGLIPLMQAVRVNAEIRDRAAPLLREMADAAKETVYFTVRDGDYVLYLYAVETKGRLMARTAVGQRSEMHCTGVGKAILSTLSREEVEEVISSRGLAAYTENTITDAEKLHRELAVCRERGYAFDCQEHEVGTYCVGAAIRDASNLAIGGCSISGTDPEIVGKRAPQLSSLLFYTSQEISRQLGHIPKRPAQLIRPDALQASKKPEP